MISLIKGLVTVRKGSSGGRVDTNTGMSRKRQQHNKCTRAFFFRMLFISVKLRRILTDVPAGAITIVVKCVNVGVC